MTDRGFRPTVHAAEFASLGATSYRLTPEERTRCVEVITNALVAWKSEDQRDVPLSVVRRWARWYLDLLLIAERDEAASAGTALSEAGCTPAPASAGLDVDFDAQRMTHAWAALEADVVRHEFPDGTVGVIANPDRWEPDRYNAAAFVKALLAKYAALAPSEPEGGPR